MSDSELTQLCREIVAGAVKTELGGGSSFWNLPPNVCDQLYQRATKLLGTQVPVPDRSKEAEYLAALQFIFNPTPEQIAEGEACVAAAREDKILDFSRPRRPRKIAKAMKVPKFPNACSGKSVIQSKLCGFRGRMAYRMTAADGTIEVLSFCLKHTRYLFEKGMGAWYIKDPTSGSHWVKVEQVGERPGSYETRNPDWLEVALVEAQEEEDSEEEPNRGTEPLRPRELAGQGGEGDQVLRYQERS